MIKIISGLLAGLVTSVVLALVHQLVAAVVVAILTVLVTGALLVLTLRGFRRVSEAIGSHPLRRRSSGRRVW